MSVAGEEQFLTDLARMARPRGDFIARVRARLAKGRVEYNDSALTRPLLELLREMREEAEDIAGWGAQASQRAGMDEIPNPRGARVVEGIAVAAVLAAQLDEHLTRLIRDADQHEATR